MKRLTLFLLALLLVACGSPELTTPAATQLATTTVGSGDNTPDVTPGSGEASGTKDVILATTTSTQDSGLLDVLVPRFESTTGYKVKPIAVGTGEALKLGEQGNADVLLVHAPKSEEVFMQTGAGIDRRLVMHNDFVIVGPAADPAGIKATKTAAAALDTIARKKATFISRGDDSGTHKKELSLWEKTATPKPQGAWYQETGTGMGPTLRVASEKQGYTLTDRGTYLAQRDKLEVQALVEGDKSLLNVYHVIRVNPEKFPQVNAAAAKAWADFLVGSEAQGLIGEFGREKFGQPLFVPDAGKSEDAVGHLPEILDTAHRSTRATGQGA